MIGARPTDDESHRRRGGLGANLVEIVDASLRLRKNDKAAKEAAAAEGGSKKAKRLAKKAAEVSRDDDVAYNCRIPFERTKKDRLL